MESEKTVVYVLYCLVICVILVFVWYLFTVFCVVCSYMMSFDWFCMHDCNKSTEMAKQNGVNSININVRECN